MLKWINWDLQTLPVPWRNIFTSLPVWAIIITHACSVFGYFTVVNQLPTYMKYILHFDIKEVLNLHFLDILLYSLCTNPYVFKGINEHFSDNVHYCLVKIICDTNVYLCTCRSRAREEYSLLFFNQIFTFTERLALVPSVLGQILFCLGDVDRGRLFAQN